MASAARSGREVFNFMLQHGGEITQETLEKAARYCNADVLQVLLEQGCEPTTNVVRRAAHNYAHDDVVLGMLLDHADESSVANEMTDLLYEVACSQNGLERMRQLLNRAGDVKISENVLLAAARNWSCAAGLMQILLNRGGDVEITEDVLLAAARNSDGGAGMMQILLYRDRDIEVTEDVLLAAARNCDHPAMQILLDRGKDIEITEDMLLAAARNNTEVTRVMQLFLKQGRRTEIMGDLLLAAANKKPGGSHIMQIFLEQGRTADITEDVVMHAAQNSDLDNVLKLLKRFEAKPNVGHLLRAAAANECCGGELVRLLLARADITHFPEDLFMKAVENDGNGTEVLLVLEDFYGRINLREEIMVKCVKIATPRTVDFLLGTTDPAHVTEDVLISAMSNHDQDSEKVRHAVIEKALHVPITGDILEAAAVYGNLDCFRFLWNRGRRARAPEDLIQAAAPTHPYQSSKIVKFLVAEIENVKVKEATMIALVNHQYNSVVLFKLLLERGI